MASDAKKTFYYHAAASSLGGFIEKPFPKIVPSQASVSLPSVGGQAASRTEAFNFEEIVSCRAADTRASGSQNVKDGPWSMTITSVVEGFNILEVVTAERLVAQISIDYSSEREYHVSLAGSSFEGLRLAGCDATPTLNPTLLCAAKTRITLPDFRQTARQQAGKMVTSVAANQNREVFQWVIDRFGWLASGGEPKEDQCVLCSLVDGVDRAVHGTAFGHAVEIPDFGRIFLGELLVCGSSIQLSMVRAELGSSTQGQMSGATAAVRGGTYPP